MTDRRANIWRHVFGVVALLCSANAIVLAREAVVSPGDIDGQFARQLLALSWVAVGALLAGMGVLIGVVWTQLNRRIKLDEDATRACFDEAAKKASKDEIVGILAALQRLDDRFRDHEKEDRVRWDKIQDAANVQNGKLIDTIVTSNRAVLEAVGKIAAATKVGG